MYILLDTLLIMSGRLGDIHGKRLLSNVPKAATTDTEGNVTKASKFVIKRINTTETPDNDPGNITYLAGKINSILTVMKASGLIHYKSVTTEDATDSFPSLTP